MDKVNERYIEEFIARQNYDVRETHNARFTDQKCIPDVLCAVAECICEYIGDDISKSFSKNDIWHSDYAKQLVSESFSKPDTDNVSTNSEYDKFFAQPIKLLAAAHVLSETTENNTNRYTVQESGMVRYISQWEKNALVFLDAYLSKVMEVSGCMSYFEDFFKSQDKNAFYVLREALARLFLDNTPIQNKLEPPRIYNKIINILAFRRKKRGAVRGQLSDFPITIEEIRYNRANWRDIAKPKCMSRQEYNKQIEENIACNAGYYERAVTKAQNFVRTLEPYSEIHRYPAYKATDAHHIFMKSEYPELADMPENIIALTGTEHYSYAHPDRNTQRIDPDYQMVCLLCKLDSIERNFQQGNNDYSLADFAKVVNTGFNTDKFDERMGFEGIKALLPRFLRPRLSR